MSRSILALNLQAVPRHLEQCISSSYKGTTPHDEKPECLWAQGQEEAQEELPFKEEEVKHLNSAQVTLGDIYFEIIQLLKDAPHVLISIKLLATKNMSF